MKVRKLVDSFNYAIEGIIYAVRTQRNMKIHMIITLIVMIGCFIYDLSKFEMLVLALTITMVIVAEMINTAIESAVDATTNYYHPLAKVAKNTAAGAVVITAVNAVIVGYIIFWDKFTNVSFSIIGKIKHSEPYMIFVVLVIVTIATIVVKAIYGEGTPLRGGMPSGHSALSFSIATTIALITEEPITIMLSYLLALIVAQSRVDSNIHSIIEVVLGGIFGTTLTIFIFQVFG
jgi:diacylglycerol kinase (ATP)